MNVRGAVSALLAIFTAAALSACNMWESKKDLGELALEYSDDGVTRRDRQAAYDVGSAFPGQPVRSSIVVVNLGRAPLILASLEHVGGTPTVIGSAGAEAAPFSVAFEPGSVVPGQDRIELPVTFNPGCEPLPDYTSDLLLTVKGAPEDRSTATIRLTAKLAAGSFEGVGALEFGAVAVGDTGLVSFTLRNHTREATTAHVGIPYSTSGDHAAFPFADGFGGGEISLAPGEERTITLQFKPTEARSHLAFLKVRTSECFEEVVKLVGTGVDSLVTWDPVVLDCGYVPVGLEGITSVTFRNAGAAPVVLQQIKTLNDTEFAVVQDFEGPDFVIPGATRDSSGEWSPGTATLSVRCKPAFAGLRQTQVTFLTSVPKQPQGAFPVRVFGGGPDIDVKPWPALHFGKVAWFAGANPPTAVTLRVHVINVGTAHPANDPSVNLRLGTATSGGELFRITPLNTATSPSEFRVATPAEYDPAVGLPATSGENVLALPIVFTPNSVGFKKAELTIFSNDADEPAVKLTLSAEVIVLPPCNYSVTPSSGLAFGALSPSETRTRTFQIRNLGTNPGEVCMVNAVDLALGSHPAYSLPSGPITQHELMPGEALDVSVKVAPQSAGAVSGDQLTGSVGFHVSTPNPTGAPMSLSTLVAETCLVIAPDEYDFGPVPVGCASATRTFNLYSACPTPVTVNALSLSGPSSFELQPPPQNPGGAWTLADTDPLPVSFTVKYRPQSVRTEYATVAVSGTEAGQSMTWVLPLSGAGTASTTRQDHFPASLGGPKADVLLTIDNSSGSADDQAAFVMQTAALLKYADSEGVNYRIAVTSTDSTASGLAGRFVTGPTHPEKFVTYDATKLNQKVQLGVQGSEVEQGLAPSLQALTPPLSVGDNAGFVREDASLAIVVMSDESDQPPRPVSYYLDALRNIKGHQRPEQFSVSAIAGFDAQCATDDGRYAQAAEATGGVKGSICTPNWSAMLAQVGDRAFGKTATYYLRAVPDLTQGPIEVKVNGTPVAASSWTYDPIANAVTFLPPNAPWHGWWSVELSYAPACYP